MAILFNIGDTREPLIASFQQQPTVLLYIGQATFFYNLDS